MLERKAHFIPKFDLFVYSFPRLIFLKLFNINNVSKLKAHSNSELVEQFPCQDGHFRSRASSQSSPLSVATARTSIFSWRRVYVEVADEVRSRIWWKVAMLVEKGGDLEGDLGGDLVASGLQLICTKRQLLPNMEAYSASLAALWLVEIGTGGPWKCGWANAMFDPQCKHPVWGSTPE